VTLRELLAEAASELPGIEVDTSPDGPLTWSRGGRPFAASSADGKAAEFLLDPAVAAAAIRTPDAAVSPCGPGWIAFTPRTLDGHAMDRAAAWFASAHRWSGPRD
jgi:hypothetical protein